MRIPIKVIPGSKKNSVTCEGDTVKVYVTAPPVEGRANESVINVLAAHYGVKTRNIQIVKGLKTRRKIVNIEGI